MPLNRIAFGLATLALLFGASPSYPATQTEAGKFVQNVADTVLAIFNNPKLSRANKEAQMYPIAVKSFDVPRTARFVLGRFWKDTPAKQREEFEKTFEHYMVHIYTGQFDQYHDVDFRVTSEKPSDATRTLVRTRITRHDGGPPLTVDWWVVQTGNTHKIIDVSVEGVSQLLVLRDQFIAVIENHDNSVAALIEHLREKIAD